MNVSKILNKFKDVWVNESGRLPLDSEERTRQARKIIASKTMLRSFYVRAYKNFNKHYQELLNKEIKGSVLEIGSGAGFLKEIMPQAITSDIVDYGHIDCIESAYKLSFPDNSLCLIVMIDVLHYLGKVESFFKEVDRLSLGGE